MSCTAIFVAVLQLFLPAHTEAMQGLNRKPGWPGTTLSGHDCYGKKQGYGPYDYVSEKSKLEVIEAYHFTPQVERLIRPKSGTIDNNIDYTLRAVPNHHRALWAKARLYLRRINREDRDAWLAKERTQEGYAPPECYFQRAKAFNPLDGVVPSIFGIYLHQRGNLEKALTEYKIAEELAPSYPELIYNIGLLYLDLGNVSAAQEYSKRANSLGYPLTGLQRRIDRLHTMSNH